MTSRDFVYWLQGYFELTENEVTMSEKQVELIKSHLAMVFIHEIDPSMGDDKHQEELDKVHSDISLKEFLKNLNLNKSNQGGGVSTGPSSTVYRC